MRFYQPFLFFYVFAYLEIVLLIEPVWQLHAMNMACFFCEFWTPLRCLIRFPPLFGAFHLFH